MREHTTRTLTAAGCLGLLVITLCASPALASPDAANDVDAVAATDHFVGAAACAPCHDRLETTYGEDLSLVKQWQASMMAHSFVDPFWQANQPIAYPFVRDLVDDPEVADDPYVARFASMLAATPASSEIIAATSVDVRR